MKKQTKKETLPEILSPEAQAIGRALNSQPDPNTLPGHIPVHFTWTIEDPPPKRSFEEPAKILEIPNLDWKDYSVLDSPGISNVVDANGILFQKPINEGVKTPEQIVENFETELQRIQKSFRPRAFQLSQPTTEFPELDVIMPDSLDHIDLAPFYDVHIGNPELDEALLKEHIAWAANTPTVMSWDGGDITENLTDSRMGHTAEDNEEQIMEVTRKFSIMQHKMMLKVPGNHEARTYKLAQMSSGTRIAQNLQIPYFRDYCFLTIKWRGNKFRILIHHGAGGAQTAGGQRNAARKELAWAKPDILWTGHMHQPLTDPVQLIDVDQETGRVFERQIFVIVSPSYLKYFGGYAAEKRYGPGLRGLTVATLRENGRIDVTAHAAGRRL
jgi:hypothetical protein